METVHIVPEGSVAKSSRRTSNTRLGVNAGAHAKIEDVTNMSCFAPIPPCSLSRGSLVPSVIMEESIQQSSSMVLLEHILASLLDQVLEINFEGSHAIGEMFKIEHECKDKDIRALTS